MVGISTTGDLIAFEPNQGNYKTSQWELGGSCNKILSNF